MSAPPDVEAIWAVLRTIPDPEFGLSIVDLGLIYRVECRDEGIDIVMTLTTPTCPSGGWIYEGIQRAVAALPGAINVDVSVVFDPPWSSTMLSESARRQLGGLA